MKDKVKYATLVTILGIIAGLAFGYMTIEVLSITGLTVLPVAAGVAVGGYLFKLVTTGSAKMMKEMNENEGSDE